MSTRCSYQRKWVFMQTATQYTEEVLAIRKKMAEDQEAKVRDFLEVLDKLPPAPLDSDLHCIREGFRSGKYHLRGLICDKCGVQLVSDGAQNLSNPPTITHICCGCGERYLIP